MGDDRSDEGVDCGDKNMITETNIRQWADRIEARSLLPVLVRRLIRETTPGLKSLRFPGNDAIASTALMVRQ